MLTLMIPVFAEEPVSSEELQSQTQEQAIPETTSVQECENKLPEELTQTEHFKQPTSKRKIAKKFIFAMLGVMISSIVLFVLLSLYNKLRNAFSAPQQQSQNETSLATPDNLTDAVRTFLDKTNY